jgi:two-component SAPR family response regulator
MLDEYISSRLQGRRVLIMEDDYLQAQNLVELMKIQGAEVLGPAPSVEEGMGLLLRNRLPDMAILDVRLGKENVFPLVEALTTIGIPFVFTSGSPDWSLPEPYDSMPHCEKPLDEGELLRALAALGSVRRPQALRQSTHDQRPQTMGMRATWSSMATAAMLGD